MTSQDNLEQQLSAERTENQRLKAECEELREQIKRLQDDNTRYYQTACALALDRLSLEELQKFSIEGYTVPFEQVLEEMERMNAGRKND